VLNKDEIAELILESFEYSINLREKYGVYDESQAISEHFEVKAYRKAVTEVNRIMNLQDETEKESRLKSLREVIDSCISYSPCTCDPYGYWEAIWGKNILDSTNCKVPFLSNANQFLR
jgi:hypothetical protein